MEEKEMYCEELLSAAETGNVEDVKSLLQGEIDVNHVGQFGFTALMWAALGNHREVVGLLIDHNQKLKLDLTDESGNTALMYACEQGNIEIVTDLLKHKPPADTWLCNHEGANALMLAVKQGKHEIVRILLEQRGCVSLDVQDQQGYTALIEAAERSDLQIMKMLLSHSEPPDANLPNERGETALMAACERGSEDAVVMLLNHDKPPDVNAQDKSGRTALHFAVKLGYHQIVDVLMKHHPPPDLALCDNEGISVVDAAISQAQMWTHSDILDLIKSRFSFHEPKFIQYEKLLNVTETHSNILGITCCAGMEIATTDDGPATIDVMCKVSPETSPENWHELQTLQNLPPHQNVLGLLALCTDFVHEDQEITSILVLNKQGGGLRDHLNKRKVPLPFRRMLDFGLDMVKAVEHVHNSGYLHSDIRAENFMLTEPENETTGSERSQCLSLTGFGLTRLAQYEETNRILPWRWTAPESLESNGQVMNTASDVYMLGVALWELFLVNQPPFHQHNSPKDLLKDQKSLNFTPLLFPIEVHNSLRNLVVRCVELEPSKRFTTTDIIKKIEAFQIETPFKRKRHHSSSDLSGMRNRISKQFVFLGTTDEDKEEKEEKGEEHSTTKLYDQFVLANGDDFDTTSIKKIEQKSKFSDVYYCPEQKLQNKAKKLLKGKKTKEKTDEQKLISKLEQQLTQERFVLSALKIELNNKKNWIKHLEKQNRELRAKVDIGFDRSRAQTWAFQ